MMTSSSTLEDLGKLLAQDKIELVIKKLRILLKGSELLDEIILTSARYNDVMKKIRLGLIDNESASLTKNQVRLALIEMIGILEKGYKENSELAKEIDKQEKVIRDISVIYSKNVNTGNIQSGGNVVIGDGNELSD